MVTSNSSKVPTGVKVIAVLYYISAVLSVLLGLLFLIGAGFADTLAQNLEETGILGLALGAGLAIVGILAIAFGVLGFFIGRGLWKAQNWARIVTAIFAILGFLGALLTLIGGGIPGIIPLIIHGLIGYYLLFVKEVRAAFT